MKHIRIWVVEFNKKRDKTPPPRKGKKKKTKNFKKNSSKFFYKTPPLRKGKKKKTTNFFKNSSKFFYNVRKFAVMIELISCPDHSIQ